MLHPATPAPSLLDEIEEHLRGGSDGRRAEVLRRITNLFFDRANSIAEEQIDFFGEIFEQLIEEIEHRALVKLSEQMAPFDLAPVKLMRRLAHREEIDVAGPVLEKSKRLTDQDLAEAARTRSQAHLLAIAGREQLNPVVTDVLVRRGESPVATRVAGNPGASFSNGGFNTLVERAQSDENLADKVARRPELTPELLKILVIRATEAVRNRLSEIADPTIQERIKKILPLVSEQVERSATVAMKQTAGHSAKTVPTKDLAQLRSQVADYAAVGRAQEMLSAFSALTDLSVEMVKRLLQRKDIDGVFILCKAAGLGWPAVKAVLTSRADSTQSAETDILHGFDRYTRLSADAAQRVLPFLKARNSLSDAEIKKLVDEYFGPKH